MADFGVDISPKCEGDNNFAHRRRWFGVEQELIMVKSRAFR